MFKLIISIFICQCAGVIGSLFASRSIVEWYVFINKPSFTPPNWVFAPICISLFTLMGVAAFLVWRKGMSTPGVKSALGVFIFQLVFNSLWSVVFFGCRSVRGGLAVIACLWLAIILTIKKFRFLSKPASWLLIPYMTWVSFAFILNLWLVILN